MKKSVDKVYSFIYNSYCEVHKTGNDKDSFVET